MTFLVNPHLKVFYIVFQREARGWGQRERNIDMRRPINGLPPPCALSRGGEGTCQVCTLGWDWNPRPLDQLPPLTTEHAGHAGCGEAKTGDLSHGMVFRKVTGLHPTLSAEGRQTSLPCTRQVCALPGAGRAPAFTAALCHCGQTHRTSEGRLALSLVSCRCQLLRSKANALPRGPVSRWHVCFLSRRLNVAHSATCPDAVSLGVCAGSPVWLWPGWLLCCLVTLGGKGGPLRAKEAGGLGPVRPELPFGGLSPPAGLRRWPGGRAPGLGTGCPPPCAAQPPGALAPRDRPPAASQPLGPQEACSLCHGVSGMNEGRQRRLAAHRLVLGQSGYCLSVCLSGSSAVLLRRKPGIAGASRPWSVEDLVWSPGRTRRGWCSFLCSLLSGGGGRVSSTERSRPQSQASAPHPGKSCVTRQGGAF